MRLKMRREVNLDDLANKPVELEELPILERINVGFRVWARNTSAYKYFAESSQNKEFRARMTLIDEVKEVILFRLNSELKGKRVVELCVDRAYINVIDDILSSAEFLSFKVTRIYENRDLVISFPNMPMRFRFELL